MFNCIAFCVFVICVTVGICLSMYLEYAYDDDVYVTKTYVDDNFIRKDK